MQQYLEYTPEVKRALETNKPILALESTLITHGLPFPQNIHLAHELEELVRNLGVTPATIALINGKIKIGLSASELELLVSDPHVVKASRRDLPFILSQKLNAGTTVAATLFCAHRAGIKIFATGGIGGVHRGEADDISADLIELARTPIAVICAGAKAILDIPKTLEFLETFSIPLVGYKTSTFPAFYTASTPYTLPITIDNINALVELLKTHWALQLSSSVLIANPIPKQDEIATNIIEPAIISAIELAAQKKIMGKDITPFLLSEISEVTQGKSLQANMSLIKHNVLLGAELATHIRLF